MENTGGGHGKHYGYHKSATRSQERSPCPSERTEEETSFRSRHAPVWWEEWASDRIWWGEKARGKGAPCLESHWCVWAMEWSSPEPPAPHHAFLVGRLAHVLARGNKQKPELRFKPRPEWGASLSLWPVPKRSSHSNPHHPSANSPRLWNHFKQMYYQQHPQVTPATQSSL